MSKALSFYQPPIQCLYALRVMGDGDVRGLREMWVERKVFIKIMLIIDKLRINFFKT